MRIKSAESFLLKVPLDGEIADSMRAVTYLEFVGLRVTTDTGLVGTGYTITVGHGADVIQRVLDSLFIDDLIGEDPHDVRLIWKKLYHGKAHWIGRAGATMMAQAAVDIALWDINAKAAERPLWQVLGGAISGDIPIYNTHGGWLNFSEAKLVDEAHALLDQGYRAVKVKVGLADGREDVKRVEAVRRAIGDDILLMADANQKWDLQHAAQMARGLAGANLGWLEEPLHPDDVKGHAELRTGAPMPIALGEHTYSTHAFRDMIEARAVDVVQVDVVRIGGVTPWLEVAALARAAGLRVCPHAGDMMQVHQHLVRSIPNHWMLEVIPLWQSGPFKHQVQLHDGYCRAPREPGASTDFTEEAFASFRVS